MESPCKCAANAVITTDSPVSTGDRGQWDHSQRDDIPSLSTEVGSDVCTAHSCWSICVCGAARVRARGRPDCNINVHIVRVRACGLVRQRVDNQMDD